MNVYTSHAEKYSSLCQILSTPLSVSHSPSSLHLCSLPSKCPHTHSLSLCLPTCISRTDIPERANEPNQRQRQTPRNLIMITISQLFVKAKHRKHPIRNRLLYLEHSRQDFQSLLSWWVWKSLAIIKKIHALVLQSTWMYCFSDKI